jgi:hypothetical protein
MLHHAETKLFFCLMHMFELFEFDFGAFFILNPKEKNKRKGTRKFRIKEKGKVSTTPSLLGLLAHSTQLAARPRAHASADRWAPPVGAASRSLARSLASSLSGQWDCPISAVARSRAPAFAGSQALPVRLVPSPATAAPMACAPCTVKPRPRPRPTTRPRRSSAQVKTSRPPPLNLPLPLIRSVPALALTQSIASPPLSFRRPHRVSIVASVTVSFAGALCTGNPQWFSLPPFSQPGPRSTPPLRR